MMVMLVMLKTIIIGILKNILHFPHSVLYQIWFMLTSLIFHVISNSLLMLLLIL